MDTVFIVPLYGYHGSVYHTRIPPVFFVDMSEELCI